MDKIIMRTVNYKPKDYETIFNDFLVDAYIEQLLSNDEHFLDYIRNRDDIENSLVMLLSIFSLIDSRQYEDMTNIYVSNDIDKAVGNDLDILGNKCATLRPQATKSSVTLTFTLNNTLPYDYKIPKNTIVSTDDGITYATVDDGTIIRGEYSTNIGALAVVNGQGSRVEAYTLNNCNDFPSSIGTVTNPQGSSGSHEAYNDNEYRQLLRNWTYSHIRGTKEAYEEFFASYDGLDDYRLVPRWDGAGTMKIIIDPSDDWIKNDLYNKLQEKTFLLIEDVLITGAEEKPIDIQCTVNVDIDNVIQYNDVDYEQVRELVEQAIKVYVDGGYRRDGTYYKGLGIGSDVIPFQIGMFVASEIPIIKSIDFKDTIRKIDNLLETDEFSSSNGGKINSEGKLEADYGQLFKSDILYVNYPYMIESDNDGFEIILKKYDNKGYEQELFRSSQSKFTLNNIELYGGWIELRAYKDNATLSFLRFYENDKDNDDYNVHICINDDEKATLRSVTVTIQGEEKGTC